MQTIELSEKHCVLKWDAIVGESPLWHAGQQKLYWVDIQRKRIHRFDPVIGNNETFDLPEIVTCLAFRPTGGLLITLRKKICAFDPETGTLDVLHEVEPDRKTRFNDGRVDPQGRLWCGTMGDPDWKAPVGMLYRMNGDLDLTPHRDHVMCSNGTAWSPDGRTMYFTESYRFTIWAYDFDGATGTIRNPRPFATLPPGDVFPDGLCVDAAGFVWSNHVGVGKVVRYDPTGIIDRELQLPVPRAVGCTFGGTNLQTLFITTAQETLTRTQLTAAPLSGSLFAIDLGISGLPATQFAF